ncbi:glycosyltransferase [Thermodesulfobacteriota bacterium]
MDDIRLSACLIVRNEERHIRDCLLSLQPLVDEIVLVDTGSTDRTPEIAMEFGARMYSFPWRRDFSAARNEALQHARGRWILSIDADERLRPSAPAVIGEITGDETNIAWTVLEYVRKGYTAVRMMRLFRRDPRIRYRGLVHETVNETVRDVCREEGRETGDSPLVIDHLGYEGDMKSKHRRYLPLLKREIERNPDNARNWHNTALRYYTIGDTVSSEQAFRTCIELGRNDHNPYPSFADAYRNLIQIHLAEGKETKTLLEEAISRFPDNPSLVWLKGKSLIRDKSYSEAITCFEWLLGRRETDDFDRSSPHDIRIFSSAAYAGIAACYFRLGEYGRAAVIYAKAHEQAPDSMEYRVKRDLCLSRAHAGNNHANHFRHPGPKMGRA